MPVISPIQLLVDAAAARWISIPSLFRNADLDSSGDVSKDELKHLLIDLNLHVDFDILWAALDKNHSGSIDEDEWMQAFNGVKPSHTASGNHVPQWQIKPTYSSDTDDGLVALVAHNKMKAQMAAFVEKHIEFFKLTRIITTGSTGMTLEQKSSSSLTDLVSV